MQAKAARRSPEGRRRADAACERDSGQASLRSRQLAPLDAERALARLETFFLQIAFWVSLVRGGLALLLTASGLFSVLSYLVEQRTKEIGVRMALGASSQNVAQLILSQTTRPVVDGLLAGVGLAASPATILIATPAGATIAEIVRVTDPIAYAASVLVIVVACLLAAWIPAARAAHLDPMRTLRQE
jgi:ABC-type antimicrobial peptide transport system permease subunit